MHAAYTRHELLFKKPARTSRGEMLSHTAYYVRLHHNGRTGFGEASPLRGLSIDDRPDFEQYLATCCQYINDGLPPDALQFDGFPSLRFAFETAQLSLAFDSPFKVFDTPFYSGAPISINGLIWMNAGTEMLEEAFAKAAQGFSCIKFKVGALDFDEECRLLESFRKRYAPFAVTLRLDANGAFATDEALKKLRELSRFDIHSIEQPIKAGQPDYMEELCAKTPIPVALDEELIGVDPVTEGELLLKKIDPQFIILKPTLVGGFAHADAWIRLSQKRGIGWWATSALESNIGLNAIAQWCSTHHNPLPQGLGTGSLYTNNLPSPLTVSNGVLFANPAIAFTEPVFS